MKLIIDIPEEVLTYIEMFKDICYEKIEEDLDNEHEWMLRSLYEGISLDNMTNGEVIETLFPNCIDYKGTIEVKTTWELDMGKLFRRSWWDAPYKKGEQ